jgi:hypothetical protein
VRGTWPRPRRRSGASSVPPVVRIRNGRERRRPGGASTPATTKAQGSARPGPLSESG